MRLANCHNRKYHGKGLCKQCYARNFYKKWSSVSKNKEKLKLSCKKYNDKAEVKLRKRCWNKGITVDYFNKMLAQQKGRCAICKQETDDLCIDHDHNNHKVRSLLCRHCNYGLGHFKENPNILLEAVSYLNSYAD